MKKLRWIERCSVRVGIVFLVTALGSSIGLARRSNPNVAYLPANWVDFVADIYPVSQAPTDVRREIYKAAALIKNNPGADIMIEAHGATQATGEKVSQYFVEKRGVLPTRFTVQEKFDRPDLDGWLVVRLKQSRVVAEAPEWDYEMISTSLASPVRTEGPTSSESLAGVMDLQPIDFRPAVGFGYMGVQTDPSRSDRISPDWLAISAEIETAFINTQIMEIGLRGHYMGSIVSMNDDSTGASAAEGSAGAFVLISPEPSVIGAVRLQLDLGFYGNWRWFEGGNTGAFQAPTRALGGNVEASTSFDDALRFGLNGGMIFSGAGIFQAGGFISHRLFTTGSTPWDIRLALNTSIARLDEGEGMTEENWSNFQIGITGSI